MGSKSKHNNKFVILFRYTAVLLVLFHFIPFLDELYGIVTDGTFNDIFLRYTWNLDYFSSLVSMIYNLVFCLFVISVAGCIGLVQIPDKDKFEFKIKIYSKGFRRLAALVWVVVSFGMFIYMLSLWADEEIEGGVAFALTVIIPLTVGFISWLIIAIQGWVVQGFSEDVKAGKIQQELVENFIGSNNDIKLADDIQSD